MDREIYAQAPLNSVLSVNIKNYITEKNCYIDVLYGVSFLEIILLFEKLLSLFAE